MNSKPKLSRISITVPENTVEALDQKIVEEHYESRSQAIVDMINNGKMNEMPAQDKKLTPAQIDVLTAYVWGLSHKPVAAN